MTTAALEFELAEPIDLTASARLFSGMYSRPGASISQRQALARLTAMVEGPWQVTEMRMDGTVAGFALWTDLTEYVFLRSFAIDPTRRRDGAGRLFMERMRAEVWPAGRQVRLEVAKGGPWAFWEKVGFTARTTGMWLEADAA